MGQSKMEKDSSRRIVDLDQVCQNNIVVEELEPDNRSVFQQEYVQAANIIDSILRLNKEKKEKKNGALHVKAEYQTVVPFIGDRGTGKTSAMCSVLQALKTSPETFLPSLKETNDVGFICMDMIDINSMKPNENLMEIVLAQMLAYMQNQEKNLRFQEPFSLEKWRSRQREIYTQIDTLSRAFSRLHWHKNFDPEEQGIVGIQKIAETKTPLSDFISWSVILQMHAKACKAVNLPVTWFSPLMILICSEAQTNGRKALSLPFWSRSMTIFAFPI